jgi:hypothetical protein
MEQRGSDKHGPMQDDALEKEMAGYLQGDHPTRAQEELESEPPADDDPDVRPVSPHPDEKSG